GPQLVPEFLVRELLQWAAELVCRRDGGIHVLGAEHLAPDLETAVVAFVHGPSPSLVGAVRSTLERCADPPWCAMIRGMAGFTILRPDEQEFAPPSWRPEE